MADQDFFLSPDDAQTLGDINYMKKSVRVRHTFPKTLKNPDGFAIEKEVSASSGKSIDDFNRNIDNTSDNKTTFSNVPSISSKINSEPANNTQKKRSQGTSMDMFRNMARNLRKK